MSTSCRKIRVTMARNAIWRTSQPVQTGLSADLGAGASGANVGGGNESAAIEADGCGSVSDGGGLNCGASGDDKQILFDYGQFTESIVNILYGPGPESLNASLLTFVSASSLLKFKRSAFRFQKSILRAPGRCMTFLHAPPVRACLGPRCGRLLRRLRGRDRRSSRHCG